MNAVGHIESKKLARARLYIKKTGETGFLDLGFALKAKLDQEIKTASHSQAETGGFNRVDHERPVEVGWKYTFTWDDFFSATMELLTQSTAGTAVTQSSATGQTANITAVQGQSFFVGKYGITVTHVKISSTTYTEGTDYFVDEAMGAITIPVGSAIPNSGAVVVTFDCSAFSQIPFSGMTSPRVTAEFRIDEYDQFSTEIQQTTTFSGICYAQNPSESDGTKYDEFELVVRARTKPAITLRA